MLVLFFFKQKTAYEMRISDWSSDVCYSDLPGVAPASGSLFAAPAGGRVACSAQLTPSFPALQPAPSFCCTTTRRAVELLLPGLGSTTPAGGVTVAVLTSRSRLAARSGGRGTGDPKSTRRNPSHQCASR